MHNHGSVEKPQNISKTIKELLKYFKEFKISLIIVFTFSILSTVLVIAGPKILAKATNTIVDGYVEQKTYDGIVNNLPEGVDLSKIDNEALIASMPNKEEMTDEQVDIIKNMDFSRRPKMNFAKIMDLCCYICFISNIQLYSSIYSSYYFSKSNISFKR